LSLLCKVSFHLLHPLLQTSLRLQSHLRFLPLAFCVVKGFSEAFRKITQCGLIVFVDACEAYGSCGFLVDEGAKTSLVLNDAVRNPHLFAKCREPHYEFNRLNITSDADKLRPLFFYQGSNMLRPNLIARGALAGVTSPDLAFSAAAVRRAVFSASVAGRYFIKSLKREVAWFLLTAL